MSKSRGYDEVLIVNPFDPRDGNAERIRLMTYGYAPHYGSYGEPADVGYYAEPPDVGYYGDPPAAYGYYAEPHDMGYYGEPDISGYGYYGEPDMGYYGEPDMSGYGLGYGYGGYAGPPMGAPAYGYGGYAQMPEMVGYGQYGPYGEYVPLAEPEMGEVPEHMAGYFAEADPTMGAYVRARKPKYNPGCPAPTNVNGFGEPGIDGYAKPQRVNPVVKQFDPQPGPTPNEPETFRPLW